MTMRTYLMIAGVALGPLVMWFALTVLGSLETPDATTLMIGFVACLLAVAGFAAFCVAIALMLKPVVEYLDREFSW